jgi:uncharacterized membrane protein YbaN (DUF454 family)
MDHPLPPDALAPISPIKRIALIALGTVTLSLGIAGMFLPGVPTTVFLLITMACYVRSSDRLYRWVMTRSWLQKPIVAALAFQQSGVLPARVKLIAQGVAWASFVLVVFTNARPIFEVITFALAASCTIAMSVIKSAGEPWMPRAWGRDAGSVAQQLWVGLRAGAFAGFIFGVAEQTLVRFVARLAGVSVDVTLQSTLVFVAGAIAAGALFGLLYAGVRRVLPSNKWLNGASFGVLMIVLGTLLGAAPAVQSDVAQFGEGWPLVYVLLLALSVIAAGVILCLGFRSLEMRSAVDKRP